MTRKVLWIVGLGALFNADPLATTAIVSVLTLASLLS